MLSNERQHRGDVLSRCVSVLLQGPLYEKIKTDGGATSQTERTPLFAAVLTPHADAVEYVQSTLDNDTP